MAAVVKLVVALVGIQIVTCRPNYQKKSDYVGTFWHVTDIHYDQFYGYGVYPKSSCRDTDTPGNHGDYHCDSPWTLVNASIYAMKAIEPNPDFIVWTGDDTPHVPNGLLSEMSVLSTIGNLTGLLMEVFPNTSFIPVFGNHDYHPKHQMPPNPTEFYSNVTDIWKSWLDEYPGATELFREKTYYTAKLGFYRFAALNTVFYYTNDKLTENIADPAGQFSWLQQLLSDARRDQEMVVIVGHVPPGCFERARGKCWFYPKFNERYIDIIQKFHDVIAFQLFAHQHDDSFRVFYNSEGTPISSLFLSPAVTPWNTSLGGVGPINPSVRLFTYDRHDGLLLDWEQHYLDLRQASSADVSMWKKEYSARDAYGVSNASTSSLNSIVYSMRKFDNTFDKYYLYNSVSYGTEKCITEECRTTQMCSITEVDFTRFQQCIDGEPNRTIRLHSCWNAVFAGLIITVWFT